ncbi:unnamed protein product, partial [Heterotrigona itama]
KSQPSSTSDERNHVKPHPILTHQKAPKLRFLSSVEFRHSSGETVTSQLSPTSPNEDSSGESRPDKPRLQRSMGQSKKTFRLRKSRRSHVEAVQVKSEQSNNVTPTTQPSILTPPTPVMEPSSFSIPSDSSSIRSRRSSSIRQSDCEKGSNLLSDQQQMHASLHHHHYHHHHYHHHLHLQTSDASWDEDTSTPPLASPDLNDMPSTSSTTTHVFEGSSPDCSINGSGGEKTALLTASQRTTSQHSLLMVFPNQDEDTLI